MKTEINILESPSVLKPIYAYVLEQKREAGFTLITTPTTTGCGLNVELVKGSSVLNIAYQDTEKISFYPSSSESPRLIKIIQVVTVLEA